MPAVVRFLIDYHADVNAQDMNGSTPLHLASRPLRLASRLLHLASRPLPLASRLLHLASRPLLLAFRPLPLELQSLHLASREGRLKDARYLIDRGADDSPRRGRVDSTTSGVARGKTGSRSLPYR